MADDVKPEGEKKEEAKPEAIDYETSARAEGWRTKEELGDKYDPARYVSAEEFMKRKPLFDTIKQANKEIKELKRTVESVVNFSQKNAELAAKRAVAELKEKRKESIKLGDVEAVEAIDSTIAEHERVVAAKPSDAVAPEIIEWTKTNKWFNEDTELQDFAVTYCANYTKRNPNKSMEDALDATATATKRAFPDNKYFKSEEPRREAPANVETHKGEGGNGKGKAKYDVSQLTPEQKLAHDQYVKKHKIMTTEKYIDSLREIGAYAGDQK